MPIPSFNGCIYTPAKNFITPVSLSVISATINGVQQAYLMQSFTYIVEKNIGGTTFNIPWSYLYFYGLNSNSTNAITPTPIYLYSDYSVTTFIPTDNLENFLFTSIINNNTSVNGQSFLFLTTNSYQDSTYKKNLPNNQWLCQFNPFYGNNVSGYKNNTYCTIFSPGAGKPYLINNTLGTNQCTITLSPALTSSSYNCLFGIGFASFADDLSNLLIVPGNSTQIQNKPLPNSNYYFLNINNSTTTFKDKYILPTSTTTGYTNDNIQMWNIVCDNKTLFLCNNLNYNSTATLNLSSSSILYTYDITTPDNPVDTNFDYQLSSVYGPINGNVCVSPTIFQSGNPVYLPTSANYSSGAQSGLFYDLSFNNYDPTSKFKSIAFSNSYNYWLNNCTNKYGNHYYLSSTNLDGTLGNVYSLYNYFTTNVYTVGSAGYNIYPGIESASDNIAYNQTFSNFVLSIDPNTNQPYKYINCLTVGPGGNGQAAFISTSGTALYGGGGGGVTQAVNIPYYTTDSNGNTYQIISMQVYVKGDYSFVTFTYNKNGSSSTTFTLQIYGAVGSSATLTTPGKGGLAGVNNTISSIYNTSNNTISVTGADASIFGTNGFKGTSVTNSTTGISVTGGTSGSGYVYPNVYNYVLNTISTKLYKTNPTVTFSYNSTGAGAQTNGIVYNGQFAQNGGGGAGINTKYLSANYSTGSFGFVTIWLSS